MTSRLSRNLSGIKRQRSQEGESIIVKKTQVGAAPMFSEITKLTSSVELGVYDRSRETYPAKNGSG